ncbi:acyl-CoA desaturase [Kineococcus aurantiacus]|uniref:Fatty acid desaturase n=1 Tax=Kineococcus aurantiacus TaxID=37633 RepID=A0A7Y9DJR1_9ACTN|nr:fatty acid desaturase [Kineococcus aurantiacus]
MPALPTEPTPARAPRRTTPYAALTAEVQEAGLMRRRTGHYWGRIAATSVAFAAVVTGAYLLRESWLVLLTAAPLAVVLTQFAFLGHDGAHRQIFATHRGNEWAARVFAALLTGLSYGWWMGKHTRHHQAPNKRGTDTDIESDVVSFHPEAAAGRRGPLRWATRTQGWWFWPLLLLAGLNLHADSVRTMVRGRSGKRRWLDTAFIVVHWAVYGAALVLLLGPGRGAAFFGVHMAAFGLAMGGAFAPNHVGMPIVPREAKVDYIRRQVLTSRNISGGWFVDLFMGGLNHQVEHHLFPSMPRPNLRAARPFVRRFCAEHGISYTETSLPRAFADIVGYLNEVGLAARDPFRCPLVSQLRAG